MNTARLPDGANALDRDPQIRLDPPWAGTIQATRTVNTGWDTTGLQYLIDGEWVHAHLVVVD